MGSYRSSQGLVIVEHLRQYNLYLSDETGVYYSLSLDNVVVDDFSGAIDIILVSWCDWYVCATTKTYYVQYM